MPPPRRPSCSWTSTGERTFLHLPGANGALREEEIDREELFSGRLLHVGGSLVMPQLDGAPTAALLSEARARGIVTSLAPVWDASGRWERLLPSLPHLDLFIPSLAEAQAVSGEREPPAVATWLRDQGVGCVALTMGAEGCYASSSSFEGQVPAAAVETIDGTGAGDAFAAGFIYACLAGWPVELSAQFANAVGALATTAVGAVEGLSGLDAALALAGVDRG